VVQGSMFRVEKTQTTRINGHGFLSGYNSVSFNAEIPEFQNLINFGSNTHSSSCSIYSMTDLSSAIEIVAMSVDRFSISPNQG
jgi:hypothetical protein